MPFPHLFTSAHIGRLAVKNRLVMPPMVRNYADTNGLVTQRYVDHIERVARGGVGTMILEASFISPEGKGFVNELGIHSDKTIPGLKRLVAAAHKHGAAIGPQLYHAGRQTSAKTTGTQPVAPSAVPDPSTNEMPRPLKQKEIKTLVGLYAKAAARAKRAGCDFVEIHGAHGYLITQFLSLFSNKRTDAYGGSFENRMRFLLEVFAEVRRAVGADFPIIVRLSGDELVAGGLKLKDTVAIAKRLEQAGANALHISAGNYASYARGMMIPPMAVDDGPLVHLASGVKRAVKIPVITVAKIRTPQMAEAIIKSKQADFVAIGRTLLADPDWPNKTQEGRLDEINPCIACNQGCISRLFAQQDVWCTVNPETSRERAFAKPHGRSKTVVIIGGGPSGMEAAKVAASRGHKVILYEKHKRLGGQLIAAGAAPYRQGWKQFRDALLRDLKCLHVEIRLNTECTPSLVAKDKPDAVIVAIGSTPSRPKIPGIVQTNVLVARDVLDGRAKAHGRIVIAGGGCAGAQTAEFLAKRGHAVTLVEATGEVALDAPVDERALLLGRLKKLGIKQLLKTKVMNIGPRSVNVENRSGAKILPADTVVLCLGSFSNNGFTDELKQIVKHVTVVGDAISPRRVTDAVAEGALAALAI